MHAPRPAPAEPRRGGPLPVPPGRVVGPQQQRVPRQRRPPLPRRRLPPRVRHPRVRLDLRPRRPRQGGRAHPRAAPGQSPSSASARRASAASSTCSRTTPTRPATPTAATRTTSPAGATTSATTPRCSSRSSCQPPDLRRRRQGPADGPGRHVLHQPAGRAHLGGRVVSATTRSRPIINTRDEPHADAERYRRLHVIVGDSNMSEYATFLKVGATSILLRMLEDPTVVLRDMTLENPIRAIREISHDITCTRRVRLANGREASAPSTSRASTSNRALRYAETKGLSPLEEQALEHVGALPHRARERPALARPRVRLGHQAQAHRGLPRPSTTCRSATPRWR